VPVTGYTITRNGTVLATTSATTFSDTTVAPSTNYSYTVTATNGSGQTSSPSTALAVTTPAGTPQCSVSTLVSAVSTANSTPGGGTVTLASGCVYTLTSANIAVDGGNGLPMITGRVTVQGNGATIARSTASGTAHFRIFDVAAGGSLLLNAASLSNGIADHGQQGGGAINNAGALSVTASTFANKGLPPQKWGQTPTPTASLRARPVVRWRTAAR